MEYKKPDILYEFESVLNKGNIFHGHGGSNNVIMTYKDNAIKLIPKINKNFNDIKEFKNDQEEINFYHQFTKHLILKNKTPHIVAYYDRKKLNLYDFLDKNDKKCKKIIAKFDPQVNKNIWERLQHNNELSKKHLIYKKKSKKQSKKVFNILNFWRKNKTKTKKISIKPEKKESKKYINLKNSDLCSYNKINKNKNIRTQWGWMNILNSKCDIVYLENCPDTIPSTFTKILNDKHINKETHIKTFIDRVIFQIIFTLCAILEKYPSFVHNDCFIRNVLAINEKKYKNNQYIKYVVKIQGKLKEYYFPANGICIKLNDFGYSIAPPQLGDELLQSEIKEMSKLKSEYFKGFNFVNDNKYNNDLWNFIRNFYKGDEFNSMTELINNSQLEKEEKDKLIKIIQESLNQYFDTKKYDTIKNISLLRSLWDITHVKELHNIIQPSGNYFVNDFNFTDYKTINKTDTVIHTFKINVNI